MLAELSRHYRRPDQLRAINLLAYPSAFPGLSSLEKTKELIQVYTIPSFAPITSWSLYQITDETYHVRRVRWDFRADHAAQVGEPTVYGAQALVQSGSFDAALSGLYCLQFPAFARPKYVCILDGVTFGMRSAVSFGNSIEMSWNSEPAPGCELLAEWYHRFVGQLEAVLPSHTDEFRLSAAPPTS